MNSLQCYVLLLKTGGGLLNIPVRTGAGQLSLWASLTISVEIDPQNIRLYCDFDCIVILLFPCGETEDCCFWYWNMNSKGLFTPNDSVTISVMMGGTFDLCDRYYDGQNGLHTSFACPRHVCDVVVWCEQTFGTLSLLRKINCRSILMNNKIFYFHTFYLAGSWCIFLYNFSIWNQN